MPPQSERSQQLINFVREEIGKFRSGEVDEMSQYRQLKERFGYSSMSPRVSFYLTKAGLAQERKMALMERKTEKLYPSQDYAWILGVLCGGGNVGKNSVNLSTTVNEDLLKRFSNIGEKLFKINATAREYSIKDKKIKHVTFFGDEIAQAVGDLRRNAWSNTLRQKHAWIAKDQAYTWSFLQGFFDTSGGVSSVGNKRGVFFYTEHSHNANFIVDLFTWVGIKKQGFYYKNSNNTEIRGVSIRNLQDMQFFANHIHSLIPKKEKELEFLRHYVPPNQLPLTPSSDEEPIQEWLKIRELLKRVPNTKEINRLKKAGLTKFSAPVYIRRFGEGNFRKAVVSIEDVIKSRHNAKEYPLPKKFHPKHYSDEEVIREWEKLHTILGRPPSCRDIRKLKKEKKTRYGVTLYRERFGNESFVSARENLERIIKEREEAKKVQGEPSDGQETQIFP